MVQVYYCSHHSRPNSVEQRVDFEISTHTSSCSAASGKNCSRWQAMTPNRFWSQSMHSFVDSRRQSISGTVYLFTTMSQIRWLGRSLSQVGKLYCDWYFCAQQPNGAIRTVESGACGEIAAPNQMNAHAVRCETREGTVWPVLDDGACIGRTSFSLSRLSSSVYQTLW